MLQTLAQAGHYSVDTDQPPLYSTRLVPTVYGWAMRRRIFGLYGELKFLEAEMESRAAAEAVGDLLDRLDGIEERASHLKVPTMFAQLLYTVRHHIGLVRARLTQRQRSAQQAP